MSKIRTVLEAFREVDEAELVSELARREQIAAEAETPADLHSANMHLIDAIAALDSFRARQRDPQGFSIGFRNG